MNIRQILLAIVISVSMDMFGLDYVEVIDVAARQRYPWNGLVDIDFELDSKATEPYLMNVTVFDNVGKTNLPVKSVCTEGVGFSQNPTMVPKDASRIVWDAASDLPDGFKCTNVLVSCQDVRSMGISNLYMIVDLSGGTGASKFSVTYTNCPPRSGWSEKDKTDKLVLRRVEPGSFLMGSSAYEDGHASNETLHKVNLTKPYYIGVFELTARQAALIRGGSGADTQPVKLDYYSIRGYDIDSKPTGTKTQKYYGSSSWDMTKLDCSLVIDFGKQELYSWPQSGMVDNSSLMGVLRKKTGLNFDLPSEAQWEYACRAGASTPLNNGMAATSENVKSIKGGAVQVGSTYMYVGNYQPNALGLYDMLGNVGEWCLDCYKDDLGVSEITDPTGASVASSLVTYTGTSTSCTFTCPEYNSYKATKFKISAGSASWEFSYSAASDSHDQFYKLNVSCSYKSYCTKRVVRGVESRSAARTYANSSHNVSNSSFSEGAKLSGTWTMQFDSKPTGNLSNQFKFTGKSNPTYGVRVALTVD